MEDNAAGEALDLCLRCAAVGISAPGQGVTHAPDAEDQAGADENVLTISPDDVIRCDPIFLYCEFL